jgi:hypothetical protein
MAEKRDGRTALEAAAWGLHWEQVRVGYYARLGNNRMVAECQQLADQWREKRDSLWAEAQQT